MKDNKAALGKVFASERKALILLSSILVYYVLIKSLGLGLIYQSIINALFWGALCIYVYLEGNVRFHSKLKHKEFYVIFMLTCAGLYVVSYFAFGIIDGYGINMYDTSLLGIAKNILTFGSIVIFREYIRNYIINSVNKKYAIYYGISIILIFSFAEINIGAFSRLETMEDWLSFLSLSVLPPLFFHAFMTFAAYVAGVWGPIIYATVTNIPIWIISVLPNFRWITIVLVGALFPLLCIIVLRNVSKSKTTRGKKRKKKTESPYSWIAVAVIMVALVWFAMGIFPIFPSVIVSNSMQPDIAKGDLVFIDKSNIGEVQVGDVIQYELGEIQVVHRIIDIKYVEGLPTYIAKGDANNAQDPYPVLQSQIRGRYIGRIPYIGWPTLLLRQEAKEVGVETGQDR